jgi:hypothetical protein
MKPSKPRMVPVRPGIESDWDWNRATGRLVGMNRAVGALACLFGPQPGALPRSGMKQAVGLETYTHKANGLPHTSLGQRPRKRRPILTPSANGAIHKP